MLPATGEKSLVFCCPIHHSPEQYWSQSESMRKFVD
ncbi:Uncharacterised protein [Vibrio cholerae]|nr:Uncharacterised protein [Vibrio cholerae]